MSNVSRRSMLHAGALGGAGMVASAAWPREHPSRGPHRGPREDGVTTFVFVAGASGGVGGIGDLSLRGHRTAGVPLPGHDPNRQYHRAYQAPQDLAALAAAPSPMKGVGLDDYTEAAVATVRRAAEHGPVVVVGGSMGGATRMNWRSADPDFLAAVKAANLAPDGTDGELMALLNGLLPDESATVPLEDARGHKDTWGHIPRTFIRHTLDRTIPLPLQNRMIREADRLTPRNRFDVRDVRTGHFPTGAAWSRLMDILDGLAVR